MAQLDENNHGGIGLFGDDEEQEQNYNDAADLNDILGLDDEDAADALQPADPEGSLLMRFCPHDSSMLYPKVRVVVVMAIFVLVLRSTYHVHIFIFIHNIICLSISHK